ncbi:MAG: hypothetical protein Q9222_002280 [Ikaeria aurantiellina]
MVANDRQEGISPKEAPNEDELQNMSTDPGHTPQTSIQENSASDEHDVSPNTPSATSIVPPTSPRISDPEIMPQAYAYSHPPVSPSVTNPDATSTAQGVGTSAVIFTRNTMDDSSYIGLPSASDSSGVPIAAVVGGVFGGVLLSMICAFGIWMASIRKAPTQPVSRLGVSTPWVKPELGGTACAEVDGAPKPLPELAGPARTETEPRVIRMELEGSRGRYELWGDVGATELGHVSPRELESV